MAITTRSKIAFAGALIAQVLMWVFVVLIQKSKDSSTANGFFAGIAVCAALSFGLVFYAYKQLDAYSGFY